MSSDEFDPYIERLFSRAPQMPDAVLFAADVEARLASGSRLRTLALSVAGLVGGCIAVRESLHLNINLGGSQAAENARSLSFGVHSATADLSSAVQNMMGQAGLGEVGLGSLGGLQLFWMATAAVVALAAAGVVKLSQQA